MGLIEQNRDLVIKQFTELFWSAGRIARYLGTSRQGVVLALNSWGYDTSKVKRNWIQVMCQNEKCQFGVDGEPREFSIKRSTLRVKMENNEPAFCSRKCYQEKYHTLRNE